MLSHEEEKREVRRRGTNPVFSRLHHQVKLFHIPGKVLQESILIKAERALRRLSWRIHTHLNKNTQTERLQITPNACICANESLQTCSCRTQRADVHGSIQLSAHPHKHFHGGAVCLPETILFLDHC